MSPSSELWKISPCFIASLGGLWEFSLLSIPTFCFLYLGRSFSALYLLPWTFEGSHPVCYNGLVCPWAISFRSPVLVSNFSGLKLILPQRCLLRSLLLPPVGDWRWAFWRLHEGLVEWIQIPTVADFLKILICHASLQAAVKVLGDFFLQTPSVLDSSSSCSHTRNESRHAWVSSLLSRVHYFLELVHIDFFVPISLLIFFFKLSFFSLFG